MWSAPGHFGIYRGLANRDALGLASEIDLHDAVRVEEDFCLARLLGELHPFAGNGRDGLTIVGADDVDLIRAVVRFEIVRSGLQLLSADRDGMVNYELG